AATTTGTKRRWTRRVLWYRMISEPRPPPTLIRNSASTIPTSARGTASLTPAKMKGRAAGSTTSRQSLRSLELNDRATSSSPGSTYRTPCWVLTRIGKTANSAITATLAVSPMPSQRLMNGTSATDGVEERAVSQGLTALYVSHDRAEASPMARPKTSASRKPISRLWTLSRVAVSNTPSEASLTKAATTCEGGRRKIGFTCGAYSCHTASTTITEASLTAHSLSERGQRCQRRCRATGGAGGEDSVSSALMRPLPSAAASSAPGAARTSHARSLSPRFAAGGCRPG